MPFVIVRRDEHDTRRILMAPATRDQAGLVPELWGPWPEGWPAPADAKRWWSKAEAQRAARASSESNQVIEVRR